MLGRFFGRRDSESEEDLDDAYQRPRFRRTRSAASESLYADYGALIFSPTHALPTNHHSYSFQYQTTGGLRLQYTSTAMAEKSTHGPPTTNSRTGNAEILVAMGGCWAV